jgi:hypothetical protein
LKVKSLRTVRRKLRQIFGKQPGLYMRAPGDQSRSVAAGLSGVSGSSMIWCGCGSLLAPIVYGHDKEAEVVALCCLDCETSLPVRVGVLISETLPAK